MNWTSFFQFILSLLTTHDGKPSSQSVVSNQVTTYTIFINRGTPETSGIYGSGSLSWDSFIFESLENDEKVIPTGTFKLQWHESAHLNGEVVPELINVPGRNSILIHEGNFENCSEGCILVGSIRDGNAIDDSKTTLETLKEKIDVIGIENCQIIIA